jgi:hypothetical protein
MQLLMSLLPCQEQPRVIRLQTDSSVGWLVRFGGDSCHCCCSLFCAAVKGSNYCASAARAVALIVSNALRLAAVNIVGDALLFLGKLGVAAACGVVAFAISNIELYNNPDKYPSTYLSSAILPIALAVLTGYIVAQVRGSWARQGKFLMLRLQRCALGPADKDKHGATAALHAGILNVWDGSSSIRHPSMWNTCADSARCLLDLPQIFFSVYEMAIDTVLLSFCEDCESNSGHPRCAPPLLLEAIGESTQGIAAAPAVGVPAQKQGHGRQWT